MTRIITALTAVSFLAACDTNTSPQTGGTMDSITASAAIENPVTDGSYCFIQALNQDTTWVNLTLISDSAHGSMVWQPYEKDGAIGKLSGKLLANGELELRYDYTIEGEHQTEVKIMKIENGKLLVKSGELAEPENSSNLRLKDPAAAIYRDTLQPVACP